MSELAVVENSDQTDLDQVAIDKEQLVTMMIEDQMFGVPILQLQHIVEPRLITPVPLAPSAIAGVMNLRGRIVTVIDLHRCLGVETKEDDHRGMGITVEYMGDLYTLLVDSIGDVRDLPRRDYEKPPATLDEKLRRLSTGVYRLPEDLLVVLDIERVLDTDILMQTPPVKLKRRENKSEQVAKKNTGQKDAEATQKDADTDETVSSDTPEHPEKGNFVEFPKTAAAEAPAADDSPSVEVSTPVGDTLFDRLGGDKGVEAAVDILYAKITADASLKPVFDGVDMDNQSFMIRLFLTGAFGGPQSGNDNVLRDAHAPLVAEKGFGDEHLAAFASHLLATLEDLGVDGSAIDSVLVAFTSAHDGLLNG